MKNEFNFGKFWSQNFCSIHNYDTLLKYVEDENAIKAFTDNWGVVSKIDNVAIVSKDSKLREVINKKIKDDIASTIDVMNNQIIVYIATLIETSTKED